MHNSRNVLLESQSIPQPVYLRLELLWVIRVEHRKSAAWKMPKCSTFRKQETLERTGCGGFRERVSHCKLLREKQNNIP